MNRKNVIAIDGKIPWHNKRDLKNFRKLTWGHIVLMGRKTFESIGKPLKGRFNIVITNRGLMTKPNVAAVDGSFITSLQYNYDGCVFIIGGSSIFSQTGHLISRIYITIIDDDTDTPSSLYFPWEYFKGSWKVIHQERWEDATYLVLDSEKTCKKHYY